MARLRLRLRSLGSGPAHPPRNTPSRFQVPSRAPGNSTASDQLQRRGISAPRRRDSSLRSRTCRRAARTSKFPNPSNFGTASRRAEQGPPGVRDVERYRNGRIRIGEVEGKRPVEASGDKRHTCGEVYVHENAIGAVLRDINSPVGTATGQPTSNRAVVASEGEGCRAGGLSRKTQHDDRTSDQ